MKAVTSLIGLCFTLSHAEASALTGLPPTIFAAGDIADCGPGAEKTARYLEAQPGLILALGDLAYATASIEDFRRCYQPTWGRLQQRIRAVPGNHEYMSAGARPYFAQMRAAAGPAGKGYYSFDFHGWHIVGLNSHVRISEDSEQIQWLKEDLAKASASCLLAFIHLPRFSSGEGGDNEEVDIAWKTLQQAGVNLVLAGHDHLYERFAPMDAAGRRDPATGMRSFVVGTGGAYLDQKPWWKRRNSEALIAGEWGVLKLELAQASYTWSFITADGRVLDAGSDTCKR